MKNRFILALLSALFVLPAPAQVEKRVEVSKAYVPSLESASKLAVEPDMTDTTRMRPEIDYAIMPLAIATSFETKPIRPATVTYWEFNRPLPFYVKAGAGYPLNSVFDFYASSQNRGTGYVVGYVNHEGRYAGIRNDFGAKNNSVRTCNRIGAAAGKYFGRHVLEGALSYENRLLHRYAAWQHPADISADFLNGYYPEPAESMPEAWMRPGAAADYGDVRADVRLGDDFLDLTRTNFEVALGGGIFFDHTRALAAPERGRQTSLDVSGRLARAFGRHRFSLGVGYRRLAGLKALADTLQQTLRASARYGVDGGLVRFEAGADYFHDRVARGRRGNYVVPYLRLDFDLGVRGLSPFLALDGDVRDNAFRSLVRQNPYVCPSAWLGRSSVDYNGRFGIGGNLWGGRFGYRLYASFSVHDNHVYWCGAVRNFWQWIPEESTGREQFDSGHYFSGASRPVQARQTVTSFHGEMTLRPVDGLSVDLAAHGYLYNDEKVRIGDFEISPDNGEPAFRGRAGLRYERRKIAFGVSGLFGSARRWTLLEQRPFLSAGSFETPFAIDLRADFEWRVTGRTALFVEGRNLLDRRLYEFPFYPEYGASFTVGVRAVF